MRDNEKGWNFAVVGCNSNGAPRYRGFFDYNAEAAKYLRNVEITGGVESLCSMLHRKKHTAANLSE